MLLCTPADAARTIRLATVAPRNSTWGKLLATWSGYRIFLKAVRRMRHGIFSRELVDRVLEITGKG